MANYNILSIDGGGLRGLIVLEQLRVLETLIKMPLNKYFHLISGTSTGGIIAAMLSLGYSVDDISLLYLKHGNKIFNKKWFKYGIFKPKYNDKYFNNILKEYMGYKSLKDLNNDLLIVAYNATNKEKKIFKSSKAKINEHDNLPLFDVVRASASAPTYFKPYKIYGGNNYYIDGGLVINNPSMISWVEALNMNNNDKKINIISFSTGDQVDTIKKGTFKGGILSWAIPSVDILLAEQSQITDYHMEQLYKRESGIYTRCNSFVKYSSGKLDDSSEKNIQAMLKDGMRSANINYDVIKNFVLNS